MVRKTLEGAGPEKLLRLKIRKFLSVLERIVIKIIMSFNLE